MTKIGSRLSLVAMPLAETFKSAAIRRHKAAHVAHADTPQNDIAQFVKEALAIAIGFDALITKALSKIKSHDGAFIAGRAPISSQSIQIRELSLDGVNWREGVENQVRAVKLSSDVAVALSFARQRAALGGNLLVKRNRVGVIELWECY